MVQLPRFVRPRQNAPSAGADVDGPPVPAEHAASPAPHRDLGAPAHPAAGEPAATGHRASDTTEPASRSAEHHATAHGTAGHPAAGHDTTAGPDTGTVAPLRRWAVSGASVAGEAHIRKGLGCDDAFAYATIGDLVVAAVADGAGSVTQTSAWGSYTVCDRVVTTVCSPVFLDWFGDVARGEEPAERPMRWLFEQALTALRARARYTGQPLGELATTLAVAIATPGLAVFAQIGDGVIALRDHGGVRTVLAEEKGEYANLTWFVQSRDAFTASFRVHTATDVDAFALSTDGMAYKITDVATGAAFVPFFEGAWAATAANELSETAFASWLRAIPDDQTGDDKTVVLAVLGESPDGPAGIELEHRVQSRRPPGHVAAPVADAEG
ncbi:PP2C family serine/threonine-protein phosphatase [Nocardia farcinica]|uniref:PP2C family serine/threonine-protein phosphatase n=1 Tax=Nocardia farcinica TaxID=37329 RepID=UPI002454D6F7|nr:PP2C family serine/threonine-protein phosphatase [Nocardia farcinica]